MKIDRPMMVPMPKKPDTTTAPTTGSRTMVSGMNGSGAVLRRHTNSIHSSADTYTALSWPSGADNGQGFGEDQVMTTPQGRANLAIYIQECDQRRKDAGEQ